MRYLNNIDKKEKLKKLTRHDKSLNYFKKKNFGEVNDNIGNIVNLSNKTLNNNDINVLKLGLQYPGCLISKVVTRANSSSALKMIGPQKCPVYLKLPFFGKVSDNFAKIVFEEVRQVFGLVR